MDYSSLIDVERLVFSKLATEAARRTGERSITNLELIHSETGVTFVCCDVGGVCVVHPIELPANAWTPALEAELVRLFRGSAEIALRQIGRIAA